MNHESWLKVKTSLLLSNVIDADHQSRHLFTNKGKFAILARSFDGVLPYLYHMYKFLQLLELIFGLLQRFSLIFQFEVF